MNHRLSSPVHPLVAFVQLVFLLIRADGIHGQPWGDVIFGETFESSVGTWTVAGITSEAIQQQSSSALVTYNSSAGPTYHSVGGNPGGFISGSDPYAPTYGIDGIQSGMRVPVNLETDFYSFDAGSAFTGVWPARAYEGVLQFDYRLNAATELLSYNTTPSSIYLMGTSSTNNLSLPWPVAQPLPTDSWQTATILLSENAGWKSVISKTTIGQTAFKTVLSTGVSSLRIPGDWLQTPLNQANSPDASQIDNVFVRQAIESPSRCTLSASGGAAGAILTATLTARSEFGALLTTQDTSNRWQVLFTYPNGSTATVLNTSGMQWQNSGIYTFTYTSTVAGAHTLTVYFSGTPISGMPLSVTIVPDVIYPANCLVFGSGLYQAVAGVQNYSGLPLNVSARTPVALSNLATSFNITQAGLYWVSAGNGSTDTSGSPVSIQVIPGSLSAGQCSASGAGLSNSTVQTQSNITIQGNDPWKNKVTIGGTNYTFASSPNMSSWAFYDNYDGTVTLSYTPAISGEYVIEIMQGGIRIAGSPFQGVNVAPGGIVALDVFGISLSGDSVIYAGQPNFFLLSTIDSWANPSTKFLDFQGHVDTGVATDPNSMCGYYDVTFFDNNNADPDYQGTPADSITPTGNLAECRVSYTLLTSSDYGVFLNNMEANQQIYIEHLTVDPGTDGYVYLPSGSGYTSTVAGQATLFQLSVRDLYGNAAPLGTSNLTAYFVPNNTVALTLSAAASTISVTYKVNEVGSYSFRLLKNGSSVFNGPISGLTVVPASASAAKFSLAGAGLNTSVAGATTSFQIQSRDAFGNLASADQTLLAARLSSSGAVVVPTITVVAGSLGLYSAAYTPTLAGMYNLSVTYNNTLVGGATSPLVKAVTPSMVSAAQCFAFGSGLPGGLAGANLSFSIQAADQFGNAISTGTFLFTAALSPSVSSGFTLTPTPLGVTTATYNITQAGSYTLAIALNGTVINGGQNYSVVIGPAAASAVRTTASGPGLADCTAGASGVVSIQVRDQHGNVLAGDQSVLSVVMRSLSGGANLTATVTATAASVGQYQATLTPTTAGAYSVEVRYAGTIVGGAATGVNKNVAPGLVYGPSCTVTGFSTSAVSGVTQSVRVASADQYGNALSSGSPSVVASFTPSAGTVSTLVANNDGTAMLQYRLATMGSYALAVTVGGSHVAGSPFAITVAPGAVSAPQCTVSGSGLSAAIAGTTASFQVLAYDANGNAVFRPSPASLAAKLTAGGGATVAALVHSDDTATNGLAVSYTVTAATAYTLNVTWQGQTVANGVTTVTAAAGAASALTSTASGAGLSGGAAGASLSFLFRARDAYGNALSSGPQNFSLSFAPATPASTSITDNGDGTATATYRFTAAGTYSARMFLAGVELAASPAAVGIVPGPAAAAQSGATGEGLVSLSTSGPNSISVQLRDAFGNALVSSGDSVTYSVAGPGSAAVQQSVVYAGAGSYSTTYTVVAMGTYSVTINVNGQQIAGSPFTATATSGTARAGSCSGSLSASTLAAGQSGMVTVQARDANGNALSTGGLSFGVQVSPAPAFGPALATATTDNNTGIYALPFQISAAATYAVAVTLSGTPVAGSPFALTVLPGVVSAGACTASGSAVSSQSAAVSSSLVVTARDSFGNPVTAATNASGQPIGFVANLTGPTGNSTQALIATPNQGLYNATLNMQTAGSYSLRVAYHGSDVSGSPFAVVVTPGPPSPLTSVVSSSVNPVVAGASGALVIQAYDAFGNERTAGGSGFSLSMVLGSTFFSGTPIDNGDGTYTRTFNRTTAGTYSVQATYNGVNCTTPAPQQSVTPGDVSSRDCVVSGSALGSAGAGSARVVQVVALDAFGNAVTATTAANGAPVAFTATLTGPQSSTTTLSAVGGGVYQATLTPNTAGTYSMAIDYNGQMLAGSPFALTTTPGPISAASSQLALAGASVVAGQPFSVLVTAMDAFGNVQPSADPGFLVLLALTATAGGPPAYLGAGVYNYTAAFSTAGLYTVTATYNRVPVGANSLILSVIAGSLYPPSCVVSGSALGDLAAGTTRHLQVLATDAFGNLINSEFDTSGTTISFQLAVSGAEMQSATLVYAGSGHHEQSFTPLTVGTYALTITFRGVAVAASPYVMTASANDVSAAQSIVTVNGPTTMQAGQVTSMSIQARDAFGNLNGGAVSGFLVLLSLNGATTGGAPTFVGNGTYLYATNVTQAGDYVIHATYNQQDIVGSPLVLHVVAGPVLVSTSSLFGGGLQSSVAGVPSTLGVQAEDGFSNPTGGVVDALGVAVVFQMATTGPATMQQLFTLLPGRQETNFTLTRAGTYTVSVTSGPTNTHAQGSPYRITIYPGSIDASKSSASIAALPSLTAGVAGSVQIQSRDAFGNTRMQGGQGFSVWFTAGGQTVIGTPTDNGDGTYTHPFNITAAAVYSVAVAYKGATVPNSPFTLTVIPGAASGPSSTAVGSGLSSRSAGDPGPVTVSARDAFGNVVTAASDAAGPIFFAYSLSGPLFSTGNFTAAAAGTFSASLAVVQAGSYSLAIALRNQSAIQGSPFIFTISPGTPSPSTSRRLLMVSGTPSTIAGVPISFLVQAEDAWGNSLGGDHASLSAVVSDAGNGSAVVPISYAGQGQYRTAFATTRTGPYLLQVVMAGQNVVNSPSAFEVTPGAMDATRTTIAGAELTKTATTWTLATQATHMSTITIATFDQYGNARAPGGDQLKTDITLLVQGGGTPTVTATDNGDGSYSLRCVAPSPGTGVLNASLGGQPLRFGSSAFLAWTVAPPVPITIAAIAPPAGPVSGSTAITISGNNFFAADVIKCQFGAAATTQGTFVNASAVVCPSPVMGAPSQVGLLITFGSNANAPQASFMGFRFYAPIALASFFPAWVSSSGGDSLSVFGVNLVATGSAWCRFSDISATGSTTDSGLVTGPATTPSPAAQLSPASVSGGGVLHCAVPAMLGARLAAVDVSLNGQQFSAERLAVPMVIDFAPSVANSAFTVGPGQSVALDVATTATVAHGNATLDGITQAPLHGSASLAGAGLVRYVPGSNFLGSDSFGYTIRDGRGRSALGVVSILVLPPPPHFATVPTTIVADEDLQFPATGSLDGFVLQYLDPVAPLSVSVSAAHGLCSFAAAQSALWAAAALPPTAAASMTTSGPLTFSGTVAAVNSALKAITYTGSPYFNGNDTLTVSVTNSAGAGDFALVPIYVRARNNPPFAAAPPSVTVNVTGSGVVPAAGSVGLSNGVATGVRIPRVQVGDPDDKDERIDGRRLTLAVTLSASEGVLSIDLTRDVNLTAPTDTPLAATGVTRVQGASVAFIATVGSANAALKSIIYDRQPSNGTISSVGDLIRVAVSDLGHFGCERLCTDSATLAMSASASIAIVVDEATPEPFDPLNPPGSGATVLAGSLGGLGLIGLGVISGVGALVYLAVRRHRAALEGADDDDEQAYEAARVYNPLWVPSAGGDHTDGFVSSPNPLLLKQRSVERAQLAAIDRESSHRANGSSQGPER